MATKSTASGDQNGGAALLAKIKGALNDVDAATQECTDEIEVLCQAARQMILKRDAVAVDRLIGMIHMKALYVQDRVNGAAEAWGCNYVDEIGRAHEKQIHEAFGEGVTHG